MTTAATAELAGVHFRTVEREIRRGNLHAEKHGGVWIIEQAEAERWAGQFQKYAEQRQRYLPKAP
jgi:hypothetical protein